MQRHIGSTSIVDLDHHRYDIEQMNELICDLLFFLFDSVSGFLKVAKNAINIPIEMETHRHNREKKCRKFN